MEDPQIWHTCSHCQQIKAKQTRVYTNNAVNRRKGLMKQPDMQTKHCSCLYSYTCLGSPLGNLGDDSTHMPPSSGLPDFWYFINPVEICSSLVLQRRSAQSSGGDPLLCWQGFVCAPPRPLEEAGPWCYFGSISQITMTRAFSSEKLWVCH